MIAAAWIWAAIVFALHVVQIDSDQARKKRIPHLDKVVHFAMFSILAFVWVHALRNKIHGIGRVLLLVFFICMAYGALLEYAQGAWFVGRDCDALDWMADMVGTIMALAAARWLWLKRAAA